VQFALTVPTVRDRLVQTALRMVLEPIFERDFAAHSYGFRPNRGCKDALRRVQELLNAGYNIIVDVSSDGRAGLRDGALRRRLRGDVPDAGGSNRGTGSGERMDGISRPDEVLKPVPQRPVHVRDGLGSNIATIRHSARKMDSSDAGCEAYCAGKPHRKGSARGYGADQTRWPIAYFDALGLFNLQHAHLAAC
jgi:hypothetical protein